MEEVPIVLVCGHCGNRTIFDRCGAYSHDYHLPSGYEVEATEWVLLKCLSCFMPTIQQNTLYAGFLYKEWPTVTEILYPSLKTPLSNLPLLVERRYQAALKVRNIEPSACAVLVGRTLEAVCHHEKAAGRTLADKINNLLTTNRIPKTLAEMAGQLRQIRNLGAHDAEDEVTDEDVLIILDFLEAILEYLYVAPAKIAAVQARLKKNP
ncbi:MAG TPA: DUF4145 domain-containing protein [Ktedonobacteraceae bacterium]|nr:DUF4145 domain-containing protein [Ktedonobacteraceae bacterium]